MTVSADNRVEIFPGSGTTGPFTFTFPVNSADDITVTHYDSSNNATAYAVTTNYTIVLTSGGAAGGVITLLAALAVGESLVIEGNTPLTQATDYANQGAFYPEKHEFSYDKLTWIVQEAARDATRGLQLSPLDDDNSIDNVLPPLSASMFLVTNSAGDGFELVSTGSISAIDTLFSGLANGDWMQYNGANWVNKTTAELQAQLSLVSTLSGLTDTTISGLASGDRLYYNGSAWVNQTLAALVSAIVASVPSLTGDAATGTAFTETFNSDLDADGNQVYAKNVYGENSAGESTLYYNKHVKIDDNTDGAECGEFIEQLMVNGALQQISRYRAVGDIVEHYNYGYGNEFRDAYYVDDVASGIIYYRRFWGRNSVDAWHEYVREVVTIDVNTDGAEDADWNLQVSRAGSLVDLFHYNGATETLDIGDGTMTVNLNGGSVTGLSISQGDLNTSSGVVSAGPFANPSAFTVYVLGTAPGGVYGLGIEAYADTSTDIIAGYGADGTDASYVTKLTVAGDPNTSGNDFYVRQTYIASSPPFDMGDGYAQGFIFVEFEGQNITRIYSADVPPWAYNGKTDIRARFIDSDGMKYRFVQEKLTMEQIMDGMKPEMVAELITQEMKNRDMLDIPHPFVDPANQGRKVVMLDPMDDLTGRLMFAQEQGEDIHKMIRDGYIQIDNTPRLRAGPAGVDAVGFSYRNSIQ